MKVFLAVGLLYINFCFGSRTFFSPDMCKFKERYNNCTFQFPNAAAGECLIFNNEVCREYNDSSSWNLGPRTVPASVNDIPVNISVVPYAYSKSNWSNYNASAINITVTLLHREIKGFAFILIQELTNEQLCRIFDFRNIVDREVMLYYDCVHNLTKRNRQSLILRFHIYPQNMKVTYLLSIPPAPLEYYDSPCSWKPLIMIFEGGLQSHHVYIKFSNAPDDFNILFYIAALVDINDTDVQSININSNNRTDMLSAKFISVEDGNFYVSINIIYGNEIPCKVAQTDTFFVGSKTEDSSTVTFVILLTVMLIFASALLYIIFRRYCTSGIPPSITLLFVHSFDCPQHKELLLAYIKFMEENYPVKIYTIYGNSGSPNAWIEEKYFASDVIVFVISEGLFHILERNNIPPLIEDHWENQLLAAVKFISEQNFIKTYSEYKSERRKQICKIYFSYSGKQHVPKCLMWKGSLFMLPKDEHKFLCFIFGCSHFLSRKTHHKKKLVNDEHVKERLKVMEETASKNMHILYKENEIKDAISIAFESLNKSAACGENPLCSSEDFLRSVFEERSEEDIKFSTQKSNLTDWESEDHVRYFVHKEFHKRN